MKIFEKRPLCLILCIMLGVFSLFVSCASYIKIIVVSLTVLLFTSTFIKKWFTHSTARYTRIICAAITLSILLSIIWTLSFFPRQHYDEKVNITGTVTSAEYVNNKYKLSIKTDTINNEHAAYKLQVYYHNDTETFAVGDSVRLVGEIQEIDHSSSYLYSYGISASVSDAIILKNTSTDNTSLFSLFERLRARITSFFIESTNVDTGGLLSALIIGDRSYLDSATSLNFRRVGISHILALSGMHLSIIMHAFERILLFLRIRKRYRVTITSVATLIYMALVGFTPSITRAGIMLIIYYVLYLLARSRDSFTSLSIAVSIIVLCSPNSVFDTSLWLSSLATLGIITLSEMQSYKPKGNIVVSMVRWIINMVLSSFFAIGCTLIITSTNFQSVSIISLLSTIIFSPLIEILIYLGFSLLLIGKIPLLCKITTALGQFINNAVDKLAGEPWVLTSTNFVIVKALIIIFTLALIAFLIFKINSKQGYVTVLAILFCGIFISSLLCTYLVKNKDEADYYNEKANEVMIIKDSGEISLFFPDQFNSSVAFYARQATQKEGITYVNQLILSGYNGYLSNDLMTYLKNIKVNKILLPTPENSSELTVVNELIAEVKKYNTECLFYHLNEEIACGNSKLKVLLRPNLNEDNHTGYVSIITTNSSMTAYISDGACSVMTLSERRAINSCNSIIVGYGKKNDFNIKLSNISKIFISASHKIKADIISAYENSGTEIIKIKSNVTVGK